MSTTTLDSKEIIKFEEVSSTLMQAEPVLLKNRNLFEKAETKALALLDTIEAEGMSDEMDSEINKWQGSAKKALSINNERRTPITQILTKIAAEFTSLENPLNPQKTDSYYSKLQNHRNSWAKHKQELQRQKEAEILKKQNEEKERLDLKSEAEKLIRDAYTKKLYSFKAYISKTLNEMSLDNFAESKEKISKLKIDYPRDAFNKLECLLSAKFIDSTEVERIINTTRINLYDELSANFRENMEVDKQEALDKLPSKKRELERIAKADAETAARLKEEAEKRKKAEEKLLKDQQEEAERQAKLKLQQEQDMNNAQTLFDAQAEISVLNESAGKTKSSYVINVLNHQGWLMIFANYFEHFGNALDLETVGKKSLNQMKKDVEKLANSKGIFIEHESIEYVEDVKAVHTK